MRASAACGASSSLAVVVLFEGFSSSRPFAFPSGAVTDPGRFLRGRKSKATLFVAIALAAYIYSLEGTTTWQYGAYATSSFSQHSLLGAIGTAQAIILAVTKPFSAKFADVFGRAEALAMSVFFYCLGFICIAACSDIHTYAAGAIIYYVRRAAPLVARALV